MATTIIISTLAMGLFAVRPYPGPLAAGAEVAIEDPGAFSIFYQGRLYGHVRQAEALVLQELTNAHGEGLVVEGVLVGAASRSPKGYHLRLRLICGDAVTAAQVQETLEERGVEWGVW
ncbi:hypothetical protein B484DRAFT_397956 [Ochromonadaceae sp. CCMP2298]|nr:hypothetical protein B484DRAFT_397956 [Ochromonadaceae sp. CCMP2298]